MKRNITDKLLENLRAPESGRVEVFDLQLPGFGVRVGTSGKRVFFVMYRAHGKLVRETIGTYPTKKLKDARKEAGKSLEMAGSGADPRAEKRTRKQNSFEAVADEFIERYAERHQRPTTLAETKRYIKTYLKPAWGATGIHRIRRSDVLRVLDKLVDGGKTTSANRLLATIRKLFNWCIERGYIEVSPAAGIRPPGKETSRSRVLTAAELGAIWNAADEMAYPAGRWIQMMIATGGQRVSDVARMRRSEIHGDVWRLETPTKSEEPHTVPLTDLALEVLQDCPKFKGGDYVFSYTAGKKAVQAFSKFKATVDEKSEVKNWRFHDIRRTVATVFGEHLALPPYIAEAVQNRRSGAISGVVAVYNRARYEKDKREALEAWAGYVRAAAAGNVLQIGQVSHETA